MTPDELAASRAGRCATCLHWALPKWWRSHFPDRYRPCGAVRYRNGSALAFLSAWEPRGVPELITAAEFGCVLHEPRPIDATTAPYRGYVGEYRLFPDEGEYFGRIAGIRDVVTFRGDTPEEVERGFRVSVDEYLRFCAERGEEPDPSAHPE